MVLCCCDRSALLSRTFMPQISLRHIMMVAWFRHALIVNYFTSRTINITCKLILRFIELWISNSRSVSILGFLLFDSLLQILVRVWINKFRKWLWHVNWIVLFTCIIFDLWSADTWIWMDWFMLEVWFGCLGISSRIFVPSSERIILIHLLETLHTIVHMFVVIFQSVDLHFLYL